VGNGSLRLLHPLRTSIGIWKMAQITQVRLVDDLDGGEAAESVAFSLDGKSYEIDLSVKHAAALRDAFAPFVSSARRAGGSAIASRPRMATRAGRSREETATIREWANANGLEVSARGRISSTVLKAYEHAQVTGGGAKAPAAKAATAPPAEADEQVVEAEATPKRRGRRKKATTED
jgi:Lsr2